MDNLKINPVELIYSINWAAFKLIKGNREVKDAKHIDSISAAMRRGEFIPPIIVDETTGTIIDGQHRYLAACDLWKRGIEYSLLVIYLNYPNPLLAAIKYNSNSKKWKTEDYVNAYIANGNNSYVLLKRFCETHSLFTCKNISGVKNNYKAALQLLTGATTSTSIAKGTMIVTEGQCQEAETTYHQLELMVNTTNCPRIVSRDNILAWLEVKDFILSKMKMDKFLVALKKYFICPVSDKKSEWIKAYLEVIK